MNKCTMIIFLLFFVPVVQGMFHHKKKDNQYSKVDQKPTIHNIEDDLKRLKEEQLQYRSKKHKELEDKPTDVRLGVVTEKK